MNNSPDFGNNINNGAEIDFQVDFIRAAVVDQSERKFKSWNYWMEQGYFWEKGLKVNGPKSETAVIFFSIWVFFTNTHDSQHSRGRGSVSI